MKTVAIVQARLGSTRLPNKILAQIAGHSMLYWVCERAKRIVGVDRVVVALGDGDVSAIRAIVPAGVAVFLGPTDDVLARYVQVAEMTRASTIVRITADEPMLDSTLSSRILAKFNSGHYDYVSNVIPPSFPDGTDTEVLSRGCLEMLNAQAIDAADREHVTLYLRRQPWRFQTASVTDMTWRADYMWSCNTQEDLDFIRACYATLGPAFGRDELFSQLRWNKQLEGLMRRNAA